MEKMDGKTMDIVAENVGKLKELFPEAFPTISEIWMEPFPIKCLHGLCCVVVETELKQSF